MEAPGSTDGLFPVWTSDVTSLRFTGLFLGGTSIVARASWPVANPPPGNALDVFAAHDVETNRWTLVGDVSLSAATNEVAFEMAYDIFPSDWLDRLFLRLGTLEDSDGDGIPDAEESLVVGTDPAATDTDGDGMPDGWEVENGLYPTDAADADGDDDEDGLSNGTEYALGTDPNSDDTGSHVAVVPAGGVAYITGEPAAPELMVRMDGLPGWLEVAWGGELVTERGDHRYDGIDDRTFVATNLLGAAAYDIKAALTNEIIGGACTLTVEVGHTNAFEYPFLIRGKNPLDATARAYITANVDAEFQPYAWMMAKHESKDGSRVYNQFNARGQKKELPNKTNGDYYGWGIGQIDNGTNGTTAAEIYNWKENVRSINEKLIEKRLRYLEILSLYRTAYQNDVTTRWFEPDGVTTNVEGAVVSTRQWSIMTLYNGAGGTHQIPFAGYENYSTPIHFDPISTNWVLYTNSRDYVPNVLKDAQMPEVE